ncbi:MAG: transglutaminase domain-containing protein [Gemmatimonadetes bacterium]|nr:transglutaminase domain-containing protein [Gemmatimonadota bacterium]
MTRRGWAIALLGAWALSLGWLVKREYFRSTGAKLAEAALSVPPGAQFYRLDLGGQQIGFASSTIDTLTDSIRVEDVLVLDVPALGRLHRTTARSTAILSRTLRLRRVDASFDGDGVRFDAHGEVLEDSVLRITLVSGSDSQMARVRLLRPIVLPSLLPLRLAFGGELKPGNTYAVRLFDPLLLAERDVRVRVATESTLVVADSADYDSTAMAWIPVRFDTVRAFRIEQEMNGLTLAAWIDAQGHAVRAESPVGFTMERSAFEIAYENFRRRDTARVARASASPPTGAIIAATAISAGTTLAPEALRELRVRLGGVALRGYDLAGGRQTLAGDTLVVQRETPTRLQPRYLLPARDTTLAPYLAPEPLVQSNDPRIAAQARQIVGRERNARKVAELLTHWVHGYVKKEAAITVPSAVQVLEKRVGDCNEHAVLYVALARAIGLPARSAAGVVYLGGRFYYHAWAEVYLGDWVAVDPTFDQFPADAAHLRFTVGGLARHVELTRLIGKLTLEVQ